MKLAVIQKKDELVERCKNGDRQGYKDLYQQYSKAMYNTCLRILNNIQDAEDILQESFIEAFKNLSSFEYRTSFGGWLKQICINRSINQLKKRKIDWLFTDDPEIYETPGETNPDENELQHRVAIIKKAMMQLPDGYRTVLSLYLLEGYDHEEISVILKVAESTTRSQYMRAKQKLLKLLNQEYEQAGTIY